MKRILKTGALAAFGRPGGVRIVELVKELVAKGIKPGGAKSFTVLQTVSGGNTAEIATGMGMNSLDDGRDLPLSRRSQQLAVTPAVPARPAEVG